MSPAELIELEEAQRLVLEQAAVLETGDVPLRGALGLRLAEDVISPEAVPSFDNSAMDGFAVRAEDTRGAGAGTPALLRVAGESRAGHPWAGTLRSGEAARISTGAAVPEGADAVVRVEETAARDGEVAIQAEVSPGCDIRRAGEDIAAGEAVLSAGARVGPAEIGVLASVGAASLACHRRPCVSVLVSGDELLEPDQPMRPGGVRNSNAYSLPALAEWAGAEARLAGSAADDLDATRQAIAAALDADVLVISGGVSVGAHDHVKQALADLGVTEHFWGVSLKPGKPAWFGSRAGTLVFGLPGNPVSAMVTFTLLVRPALTVLSGGKHEARRTTARLARDYDKRPGRTHAVRCRLELHGDGWHAEPFERQGSHVLTSMLGADCLAIIPAASGPLEAGEPVEIELLG